MSAFALWSSRRCRRIPRALSRPGARRSVASGGAYRRYPLGVSDVVRRDELEAAIEARRELGAELEPAVIDAFVERIEQRLDKRRDESEQVLKRKREHQKEMVLGAMGISIPLLAIAAVFTGLAGVIVVCAALAVIAVVSAR